MSPLHDALTEYLATRRALGTQLRWPASSLRAFVAFVEAEGAEFITADIAVRWAVQSVGVQRATHARRLAIVRGFAAWLQATDARTGDERGPRLECGKFCGTFHFPDTAPSLLVIPPSEAKFYPAIESLQWREQHLAAAV
jgi:hypothetical protein